MTKKKVKRNPVLVIIATLVALINVAMIVIGVLNFADFGWFSWLLIIGGASGLSLAITAIVTGKSEWLLVELLFPN